nr:hypothetical protein GCM10025730_37710 [Promicromonospora thailandica]
MSRNSGLRDPGTASLRRALLWICAHGAFRSGVNVGIVRTCVPSTPYDVVRDPPGAHPGQGPQPRAPGRLYRAAHRLRGPHDAGGGADARAGHRTRRGRCSRPRGAGAVAAPDVGGRDHGRAPAGVRGGGRAAGAQRLGLPGFGAGSAAGESDAGSASGADGGSDEESGSGSGGGSDGGTAPDLTDSVQYAAALEDAVNGHRTANGLPTLVHDTCAYDVALERAQALIGQELAHAPLDPIFQRCPTVAVAENLAKGGWSPAEAAQGWMDSEGHRANILNGDLTRGAIACVPDGGAPSAPVMICAHVFLA